MIVTFEGDDEGFGSAYEELKALGLNFVAVVFEHFADLIEGLLDVRYLKVFEDCDGVEMFLASVEEKLVVYAASADADGDLTITVMFAGRHGVSVKYKMCAWGGQDYDECRRLVHARAQHWFR